MSNLTARVKQCALDHGFDLARVTTAEPFLRDERAAVERVREGLMDGLPWYTEERVRKANRPRSLLEGAKSVVSLAVSYNTGEPDDADDAMHGKGARYAWGDDYHELLKPRLRRFADALAPLAGESDLLVLMGDVNLQSHSSLLFYLMQTVGLESVPSLSTAPPTWPTSSAMFNRWAVESGYRNSAHHPEAQPIRIDHTLVHRRESAPLRIADNGRFGTRHCTDDLFASDHWGLWVDLAVA